MSSSQAMLCSHHRITAIHLFSSRTKASHHVTYVIALDGLKHIRNCSDKIGKSIVLASWRTGRSGGLNVCRRRVIVADYEERTFGFLDLSSPIFAVRPHRTAMAWIDATRGGRTKSRLSASTLPWPDGSSTMMLNISMREKFCPQQWDVAAEYHGTT